MEFKDRLRQLRNEKEMSQEQLGKRFNVIKQTISSWETGASRPDINLACELANFFNVSTDYLLGRTNIRNLPNTHNGSLPEDLPPEAIRSIEEYKELIRMKYGKPKT